MAKLRNPRFAIEFLERKLNLSVMIPAAQVARMDALERTPTSTPTPTEVARVDDPEPLPDPDAPGEPPPLPPPKFPIPILPGAA